MASTKQISRFDIYWVNLDPTIGSEIRKICPCVIVSPDEMNRMLQTVTVVPLTSTIIAWPFRTTIISLTKKSSAACDQIRTISKDRLRRKAGRLNSTEQHALMTILQTIFSL
jgi:mRNA interferase MazF